MNTANDQERQTISQRMNAANDQQRNTDQPTNEYGKRSAKKHGSANE